MLYNAAYVKGEAWRNGCGGLEKVGVFFVDSGELVKEFKAHFVVGLCDGGPDGNEECVGSRGEGLSHSQECSMDNVLKRASPTGVDGGYGVVNGVENEYRRAVCRGDGEANAG